MGGGEEGMTHSGGVGGGRRSWRKQKEEGGRGHHPGPGRTAASSFLQLPTERLELSPLQKTGGGHVGHGGGAPLDVARIRLDLGVTFQGCSGTPLGNELMTEPVSADAGS